MALRFVLMSFTLGIGTVIVPWSKFFLRSKILIIFRLDALALSVIATATWLGGWLAGWLAGWLGVCHTPVLYQNG